MFFVLCFHAYLDDIIIFGRTWSEHLANLRTVLLRMREAGIFLKPKKCHIGCESIEFLGHTISARGVSCTDDKIKAIAQFPVPKNSTDVRSFVGLVNFYRTHVKKLAEIQRPLNRLMGAKATWEWTAEHQRSFEMMKQALTTAPVLGLPDYSLPFWLTTDASNYGVGAILSQVQNDEERVIGYYSRCLNPAEMNYGITEKEALAMVSAIGYFRPYLYGRRFTVVTDHQALVYLQNNRAPTGRLARWIAQLMEFDYDVKYRPGSKLVNADALSRYPVASTVNTISAKFDWDAASIRQAQQDDDSIKHLIDYAVNGYTSADTTRRLQALAMRKELIVDDGIVYRLVQNDALALTVRQLILPASLRTTVLQAHHDSPFGAHFGFTKMFYKIRQHFYWPNMAQDILEYVNSCPSCGARKLSINKPVGELQPITATEPFDIIGIDLVGPLPRTKHGYKYILVIQDLFSKWPEAFPIKSKKAEEIVEVLLHHIVSRFGSPRQILSDRGTEFLNSLVNGMCRVIGSVKINTSGYRPQTDGQVERFNRTLMTALNHFVSSDQDNWNEFIPYILFAYRTSPQESTKLSPFEVLYGRIARSPLLSGLVTADDLKLDPQSHSAEVAARFLTAYDIVRGNISIAQDRNRRSYNVDRREYDYNVGDLVWFQLGAPKKGKVGKLAKKFEGPFMITQKKSNLNYSIVDIERKAPSFVVNVNRIKPFASRYTINPDTEPSDETKSNTESQPDNKRDKLNDRLKTPTVAPVSRQTAPASRAQRTSSPLATLADILTRLRHTFEHSVNYGITAIRKQLSELLCRGSIYVTSSTLNTSFGSRIGTLKDRAAVLNFLQQLTDDFNRQFTK